MSPIRRRFGQNFLTDQHALGRIAAALELTGDETVLEVGPGRGALTAHLVGHCRRLVAIEIDRDLAAALGADYGDRPGVEIVTGDVLQLDLDALAGGAFALVGNVPYYITTPIIFQALDAVGLRVAVFLVQREVAGRLAARPGTEEYGALTVNVALSCSVELVGSVPPGAFFPRPRVHSAIVRLRPLERPLVGGAERGEVQRFVTAMFGQRRRQLQRALRTVAALDAPAAAEVLSAAECEPTSRPEELEPSVFARLAAALRAYRVRLDNS